MSALTDMINKQRAKLQRGNNNRPEKLQSEKNLVRILLNTVDGAPQLSQDWGQHFIKDSGGNLKAVYICTQTNFDEPCPICEAIASGAALTSDEDVLKTLKDARSSKRILVNALYLKGGKHDKPETTPVVLDLPLKVWDSILATYQAFEAEGVNVFDDEEGHNFMIEKSGSGMNTEYKVTPTPRATKVTYDRSGLKDLAQWARQESEADRAKAITSVRVISGNADAAPSTAPRLTGTAAGKSETNSRLSSLDADAIDAEFTEVPSTRHEASPAAKPRVADEIDDFLAGLD